MTDGSDVRSEAWGEDNSGHDTDCDCKACLIDTWHAEVKQERALARRYRRGLQMIAEQVRWCPDYAMCDHVGCESAHQTWEVARAALSVEEAIWPLRSDITALPPTEPETP